MVVYFTQTFPNSICPKGKEIVWLEFELTYYDVVIQHVSHYATNTAFLQGIQSAYFMRSRKEGS